MLQSEPQRVWIHSIETESQDVVSGDSEEIATPEPDQNTQSESGWGAPRIVHNKPNATEDKVCSSRGECLFQMTLEPP